MNYTKFVGLDVHKSTISVVVAYSHLRIKIIEKEIEQSVLTLGIFQWE